MKYHGCVTVESLRVAMKEHDEPRFSHAFLPIVDPVNGDTMLTDLLGAVADCPIAIPVTDETGKYLGAISKARLLRTLDREG